VFESDEDGEQEDREHLAEVAQRLRAGRMHLAMTIYSLQRRRRTPEQVRRVLDQASCAVRRSQVVRLRWHRLFSVQ